MNFTKYFMSTCTEIYQKYAAEPIKATEVEEEDILTKGHNHVFNFYEDLSADHRKELDTDFDSLAIQDAEEAFETAAEEQEHGLKGITVDGPNVLNWERKRPPTLQPGANVTKVAEVGTGKLRSWRLGGLDLYNKERVAIVIMSGGVEAEMGVGDLPKGALDVGLLSHKSIFQIYSERIRRVMHLAHRKFKRSVNVPVYIMCNRQNREHVEDFFRDNAFFGMREQDIVYFTQGYMPVFDVHGKILLAEKHRIMQRPNGNGGLFKALVEEGMISDMKSRGVTCVFACSVHNLLCKVGDPLLIGYCDLCKSDVGIKCIERLSPEEVFGVFCSTRRMVVVDMDGDGKADNLQAKTRPRVIEFAYVPEDLKKRRLRGNSKDAPPLMLHSGNLSQFFFKVDFIVSRHNASTRRWHMIRDNVEHVDIETGEKVRPQPEIMNAIRLEMFVFDCFELVSRVNGLEVTRSELAMLRNPAGLDSPQTALDAMGKVHQEWILAAGGQFMNVRAATDRDDTKVEISPLVSYEGEDLWGHFPDLIQLPFYLPSQQELLHFSAATSTQTKRQSTHYLDWESELAQRELEAELQGQLGMVMEHIENQGKEEYTGERAEQEENLPPTPRTGEFERVYKRNSRRSDEDGEDELQDAPSASPRSSQGNSPRSRPSGADSPTTDSPGMEPQQRKTEEQPVDDGTESKAPKEGTSSKAAPQEAGRKTTHNSKGKETRIQLINEKRGDYWGKA